MINKILLVLLAASMLLLGGCMNSAGGQSSLDRAGELNDVVLNRVVLTLCDPLRYPAIQRQYADKPEKMAAINELCARE